MSTFTKKYILRPILGITTFPFEKKWYSNRKMNFYTEIKYFSSAILYYIAKFEDGRIKINFARPIFVKKVKKFFFLGINKKKNV